MEQVKKITIQGQNHLVENAGECREDAYFCLDVRSENPPDLCHGHGQFWRWLTARRAHVGKKLERKQRPREGVRRGGYIKGGPAGKREFA